MEYISISRQDTPAFSREKYKKQQNLPNLQVLQVLRLIQNYYLHHKEHEEYEGVFKFSAPAEK
jgi:hypothetical protein